MNKTKICNRKVGLGKTLKCWGLCLHYLTDQITLNGPSGHLIRMIFYSTAHEPSWVSQSFYSLFHFRHDFLFKLKILSMYQKYFQSATFEVIEILVPRCQLVKTLVVVDNKVKVQFCLYKVICICQKKNGSTILDFLFYKLFLSQIRYTVISFIILISWFTPT